MAAEQKLPKVNIQETYVITRDAVGKAVGFDGALLDENAFFLELIDAPHLARGRTEYKFPESFVVVIRVLKDALTCPYFRITYYNTLLDLNNNNSFHGEGDHIGISARVGLFRTIGVRVANKSDTK